MDCDGLGVRVALGASACHSLAGAGTFHIAAWLSRQTCVIEQLYQLNMSPKRCDCVPGRHQLAYIPTFNWPAAGLKYKLRQPVDVNHGTSLNEPIGPTE